MKPEKKLQRRCPISRKNPNACTYPPFRESCAAFRTTFQLKTGKSLDYCGESCIPAKPPEPVILKQPSTDKRKRIMGSSKKTIGECDSCGQPQKSLVKHFDEDVYSMCMPMRVVARNHPKAVLAALRKFGNLPKETAVIDKQLQEEVAGLKEELAQYMAIVQEYKERPEVDLHEVQKELQETKDSYQAVYREVSAELGYAPATDFNIATEVSILKQENDRLREQLTELSRSVVQGGVHIVVEERRIPGENTSPIMRVSGDDEANIRLHGGYLLMQRDNAILDIALDCLAGKITGLDVERLQALR